MTATRVDGKGLADAILENLKVQCDALPEPLHLAAVCVGDDPGLKAFVKIKQKAAQSVGMTFSSYMFDADDVQGAIDTIDFLAADESVHGIFIELPIPAGWDTAALISRIPSGKDVDALTGKASVPEPAVRALQYVLAEYDISPDGLRAAVVGQGALVGVPITRWLTESGADVSVIDINTPNPELLTIQADLVIAGAGVPELVTGEWIKEGACVIDFGYARKNDAYVGDVEQESVSKKAKILTPVPGGMGPLVVAAVLENLVALATR
jgi:methylenetetrahydrofolate dehydrogenase (NADP+)/methenyltetrahydrofolate cyclohydrolase